jgi:hypothetical protein
MDDPDYIRHLVAKYLYGKFYTEENTKSIAILDQFTWYKYPIKGEYARLGNMVRVAAPGREPVDYWDAKIV